MMEPHATLAMWDGDKLTLHTSNQMLNQGRTAVARTLKNLARERPAGEPPYRRRVRVEAVGERRRDPGGDRGAPAQAAGEDRADPAADLSCHDPSLGHGSAHPLGDGPRRPPAGDRARRVLGQSEPGFEGAANKPARSIGANRLTRHRLVPLDIPVASSMRAPGEAVGLLALPPAASSTRRPPGLRRSAA